MTRVGSVYAQALYDLAKDEGLSAKILSELKVLREVFAQNADFLRLLSTPNLSKEERCGILDEGFRGKIDGYLLNFMKILCENGTIRQFSGCAAEFRRRYNEANGILEVRAVTAVPMDEDLTEKLRSKLTEVTGKEIDLSCRVDPSCLGGVRLEMDGRQLDGTVQHGLDTIRRRLTEMIL